MKLLQKTYSIQIPKAHFDGVLSLLNKHAHLVIAVILSCISIYYFNTYLQNNLGLAYNDARSHLDIGRRVVEGLKPGLAQLGSVWLPLNHILMVPLIWHDWMWHSGFAGAIQSMIGFVASGLVIYYIMKELRVGMLGRLVGVAVFAANINILYLQSTAMTELFLIATMTIGVYELILWHKHDNVLYLIRSAFWIMLASLTRYDGWFLLGYASVLVAIQSWKISGFRSVEGKSILFLTLAAFGIMLWLLWNLLIFKDPLYFALGPFSAHAQQLQLEQAGELATKYNLWLSIQTYMYAVFYNTYTFPTLLALIGFFVMLRDRVISGAVKISASALFAPLLFNILALFMGFSVLFIQGINGTSWFNVRYGIMIAPTVAIFIGYLVDRAKGLQWTIIGLLAFVLFFAFANGDAVTIDDARVGSSQKNVSEVSGYLNKHAKDEKGFILISAASHDAIIFSSGLPMKRFIHEGTGLYWENALALPDRWARWIVMRTHDDNDLVWKGVSRVPGFALYQKVASYPFADIYEIDASRSGNLNYDAVLDNSHK